jgi:hypothetical protein
MTLVEQVAKAIYERWANYPACVVSKSWEDRVADMPASAEIFRGHAIAALRAARDATGPMLMPGNNAIDDYDEAYDPRKVADFRAFFCWQAMIDAALTEQEQT